MRLFTRAAGGGSIKRVNDVAAADDAYYNYDALDRLVDMRQGSATGTVLAQYAYSGAAGASGLVLVYRATTRWRKKREHGKHGMGAALVGVPARVPLWT